MSNHKKNIDSDDIFAEKLLSMRKCKQFLSPVKEDALKFVQEILALLFPHYSKKNYYTKSEIQAEITLLKGFLERILKSLHFFSPLNSQEIGNDFFSRLPKIHEQLLMDADAIAKGDPACENLDEVILSYPGFFAIAIYRFAHEFYLRKVPVFPRILTEYAHQMTGIDIHPGASIGDSFFIDHGTGIVIGETSNIGKNVKIYQGVTLGALSVDKNLTHVKRHPTIEDYVVIYSGATILGGKTVVGHHSTIGGNVWLTESVPPYSMVFNKSEVRVRTQP